MPKPAPDVRPQIVDGDLTEEQLREYLASGEVGVDTETLGLQLLRDRLCLVQLCNRAGRGTIVRIPGGLLERVERGEHPAPRLRALMEAPGVLKLFHFARFDVAALRRYLGARVWPLYCTRTVS